MRARSKARKRAVDLLYEADVREEDPLRVVAAARARPPVHDVPPLSEQAVALVEGVARHRERIDEVLREHARDWTLERMPAVDRTVLRLGVFELLWADDVPDGVVLSEAVELVASLSTDDSPRFVNGLLARVASRKDELLAAEGGHANARDAPDAGEVDTLPGAPLSRS